MKAKYLNTLIVVMVLFFLSACAQEAAKEESAPPEENTGDVVEIKNADRTVEFTEAPKRAVSLNQHVTEIMLALGLEDSMVGTAYLDDEILPAYKDAYDKVPVLAEQYPSQEVLLAAEPDFVFAGWKSAFKEDAIGSIEELESFGIKSYLHQSSNMTKPTMEDVFTDIRNIGKIFRVEDRAEKLIEQMESDMNAVASKVGNVDDPVKVFVYDSGEKEAFTAAQNFMNDLITHAGGDNIFQDIEKGWTTVSWEEIVNRNPEVIVIMDYGEETVEEKKAFLLNHPALSDVKAVQEERFLVLPLSAAAEGVRGPQALTTLAEGFYPEKFE